MMDSSGDSSGSIKPAEPFENLWRQLGECHQNALQELEAKVSKLKKDRCLDAQRLEMFYNRNQQLKEQNNTLQYTISLLEERLATGECDRCAILEENLKSSQDQNLQLITKLKTQRNKLEDENKKLRADLQKLKASCSEPNEASSLEQEEGVIPDSPVLPSSLPVANKLSKRKHNAKTKHVRYAEIPLPQSNNSLFNELNKDPPGATKNPGNAELLVANTCELDASQILNGNDNMEEVVAETCAFELFDRNPMRKQPALNQQSSPKGPWNHNVSLRPYCCSPSSPTMNQSPDSTADRSPSLLPLVKRFSEGSNCRAKRRKEESDPEMPGGSKGVGGRIQPELINRSLSFGKEQQDRKDQSAQTGASSLKPNVHCTSPAFKKPHSKMKGNGKRRTLQDPNAPHDQPEAKHSERRNTVEPMWSIDPALALSMYDSEQREDEEMEEQQRHEDLADTDCTWVSHSMLQRGGDSSQDRRGKKCGLGEKANDSLDMMFDTTAHGEYKSYNGSHLDSSQLCGDNENVEEEKEEQDKDDDEFDPPESTPRHSKARQPTFAHVAVVRKKDERRKLKGTTCKECEVYYAHLPEEEKQKKLSACSRHRFLYIPPCTPENFWEVGFPSTQTCVERGYIKEEKNPQSRLRRRQPLNALFSPKQI